MTTAETAQPASSAEVAADTVGEQLAARLVEQAKTTGPTWSARTGCSRRVTKLVLENALAGELTGHRHLGDQAGDPAGRNGGNSPSGTRDPTVITESAPWRAASQDRDGTFESVIVRKRQRRLVGVEDLVCRCRPRGLTPVRAKPTWPRSMARGSPARRSPPAPTGSWRAWPPASRAGWTRCTRCCASTRSRSSPRRRRGQPARGRGAGVMVDGERDLLGWWAGDGDQAPSAGCTCSPGARTAAW
jgi:putative transposase